MKYLVSCKCGNTDEFARSAFKMLFPNEELPEILSGRIVVKTRAQDVPEFKDELMALVNSDEPFAYYFDTDTPQVWDLLKGVRVR